MVLSHVDFIAIDITHAMYVEFKYAGYPMPNFTCFFEPQTLDRQLKRIENKSERKSIESVHVTSSSLFRHEIKFDFTQTESGVIRCIAENSFGRADVDICVEAKFFIHNFDGDRPINVGQELLLLCINSDDSTDIDWYLNKTLIESIDGE